MIQFPYPYVQVRVEEYTYLVGKKRVFKYDLDDNFVEATLLKGSSEEFIKSLVGKPDPLSSKLDKMICEIRSSIVLLTPFNCCSICYSHEKGAKIVMLQCGHSFHETCVEECPICPECKQPITEKPTRNFKLEDAADQIPPVVPEMKKNVSYSSVVVQKLAIAEQFAAEGRHEDLIREFASALDYTDRVEDYAKLPLLLQSCANRNSGLLKKELLTKSSLAYLLLTKYQIAANQTAQALQSLEACFCLDPSINLAIEAYSFVSSPKVIDAVATYENMDVETAEQMVAILDDVLSEILKSHSPPNFFTMLDKLIELEKREGEFCHMRNVLHMAMALLKSPMKKFSSSHYIEKLEPSVASIKKNCEELHEYEDALFIRNMVTNASDQFREWAWCCKTDPYSRNDLLAIQLLEQLGKIGYFLGEVQSLQSIRKSKEEIGKTLKLARNLIESTQELSLQGERYLSHVEKYKQIEERLIIYSEAVRKIFQSQTVAPLFGAILDLCQLTNQYGSSDISEEQFIVKWVSFLKKFDNESAVLLCQQLLRKNPSLFEVYLLLSTLDGYRKSRHILQRGLCQALQEKNIPYATRFCNELQKKSNPLLFVQQLAQLQFYHLTEQLEKYHQIQKEIKIYYIGEEAKSSSSSSSTNDSSESSESWEESSTQIQKLKEKIIILKADLQINPSHLDNYRFIIATQEELQSLDETDPKTKSLFWKLKQIDALIKNEDWVEASYYAKELAQSAEILNDAKYDRLQNSYLAAAEKVKSYELATNLGDLCQKRGATKAEECAKLYLFAACYAGNSLLDEALAKIDRSYLTPSEVLSFSLLQRLSAQSKKLAESQLQIEFLTGVAKNSFTTAQKLEKLLKETNFAKLDCETLAFGDEEIFTLARIVKTTPCLKILKLESSKITKRGAAILAEGLMNHPKLQELHLGYDELDDEGITFLSKAIGTIKSLTILYLPCTKMTSIGARNLAENIKNHPSLTKIYLNENNFGDEGVSHIAKVVPTLRKLESLCLSNTEVSDAGISCLAMSLLNHPAVDRIRLSGNKIGDAGAVKLAESLMTLKICVLDIDNNEIGNLGIQQIALALSSQKDLISLYLNFNKFDDEGGGNLVASLQHHIDLQYLTLHGWAMSNATTNKLVELLPIFTYLKVLDVKTKSGCEAAAQIMSGLESCKKLSSLSLSNEVGSKKADSKFREALLKLPPLEELVLSNYYIGVDEISNLRKSQQGDSLKRLTLSGCEMNDKAINALSKSLRGKSKLTYLNLRNNRCSPESVTGLKKLLPSGAEIIY